MSNNPSDFLIQLEKNLTKEYKDIMQQEKEFWALKSRLNWAKFGDCNTAFFHTTTLVRRHRNKIKSIQNSVGEWIMDEEGIKKHILLGFQQLFQTEDQLSPLHSDIESFSCSFLFYEYQVSISRQVTEEEITKGFWGLKPFKAPGADGLHAGFFPIFLDWCQGISM